MQGGPDPSRVVAPARRPSDATAAAPSRGSHEDRPVDEDHPLEEAAELGGRGLVGLAAVIVGAVPFLALLALVESRWPPLQRLDTTVVDALNAAVAGSPVAVRALGVVTDAGDGVTAAFVLTLTGACLVIRGRTGLAGYLAVAGVGLAILSPVTKALVGRARPEVALPVVDLPTNASFPSGHAMTAAVTWGALLLVALPGLRPAGRRLWTAVTALVVLAVGVTRIALGVHFVSDVLAGWALGLAWLAVVTVAFRRWLGDRGEPVAPVGTGVVLGRMTDGAEPALPDGGRTVVRLVAGWAVVLVAVVVPGLLVAGRATGTAVGRADAWLVGAGPDGRGQGFAAAVEAVSAMTGWEGLVMAALAGAGLGVAALRSWRPALLLVAAAGGAVLLAAAAAAVVGAVRPDLGGLAWWSGGTGYPSARTAAATAVLGGIALLVLTTARRGWRWGVVVAAGVALLATTAVELLDRTRAVDVVAGTLLGCLWLAVLERALLAPGRRAADVTSSSRPPTDHRPWQGPRREARP